MNNENIENDSIEEIVIVVPEDAIDEDGELEIDLDELGIDIEELGENVNIVVQIEGEIDDDDIDDDSDDEESSGEPNEWYFDDDPYGVVYYEFPDDEE